MHPTTDTEALRFIQNLGSAWTPAVQSVLALPSRLHYTREAAGVPYFLLSADEDDRAAVRVCDLGAEARGHAETHRGVVGGRKELGPLVDDEVGGAEHAVAHVADNHHIVGKEVVHALE